MKREIIYKVVFKYLELNPKTQLEDLANLFPKYNINTLKNYLGIFRRRKGLNPRKWQSYKPETMKFLSELNNEELAEITNTQLKIIFPEVGIPTLSLHLSEARKERNVKPPRSRRRKDSKREKIYIFLDNNPTKRTANDIFIEFPKYRIGTIQSVMLRWYAEKKLSKPEGVLFISAKWTNGKLEKLRKEHYGSYVTIMNRLNKEPKPQKFSPTYEAIHKVKDNLTEEEKKELTPAKACMLVSCKPAVELLKKIYFEYSHELDYYKTKKIIQEIEKRLFKKNIFRSYASIIGTAIYLANKDVTQTGASKMMVNFGHCTDASMRSLCKIVKLAKKNYWSGYRNEHVS